MKKLAGIIFIGAALVAGAANAQQPSYDIGQCHMDHCSWFRVLERTVVSKTEHGRLLLGVTVSCGTAHKNGNYPDRHVCPNPKVSQTAAFCSQTRPSLSWKDEKGNWFRTKLQVNTEGQFGFTESAINYYLRICHNVRIGKDGIEPITRRFGYQPNEDGGAQDTVPALLDLLD